MSSGKQRHQQRQNAVAQLGRGLSRRARNRCELCQHATSLQVIEIAPIDPDGPCVDRAAMLCRRCAGLVAGGKLKEPNQLRFLEESIWSETLPVQLASVRLTRALANQGVDWAVDTLDILYLDPEIEELTVS